MGHGTEPSYALFLGINAIDCVVIGRDGLTHYQGTVTSNQDRDDGRDAER